MEEFLGSLDMTNLKTMIENDSDYGDEDDIVVCDINMSQSNTSMINCSQSMKSNIKSPKNKYKKPTYQIQQPKIPIQGRLNAINGGIEHEKDLSLQDHSEDPHNRNQPQMETSGGLNFENAAQLLPDKLPAKAISDLGSTTAKTVGVSSQAIINAHDSISTQCTAQPLVQKVTHKTPQIKPSAPGLSMMPNCDSIPDNYSNDDNNKKDGKGFALPLVGRRRKASEAGFAAKPNNLQINKR